MKLKFISYLQSLGIILVVAGHSLQLWNSETKLTVMKLIYSFHMPLFFFISGFLLIYTSFGLDCKKTSGYRFVAKKVSRLLLPYMVLTAITFVPRAMLSSFAEDSIPMTLDAFARAFLINGHNPVVYLWYLQADFILLVGCFCCVTAFRQRMSMAKVLCFLGVVAAVLPYVIDFSWPNVFSWLEAAKHGVFFVAGMVYCQWRKNLDRILRIGHLPFTGAATTVWIFCVFCDASWIMFALCAISGIAMCVSVAQVLAKRGVTFLDRLDGASYMIYLLSWYINVSCQQLLSHFVNWPWWIHSLLSLVLGILLPLAVLRCMEDNRERCSVRTAAWLLGHRLPPKAFH